MCEGLFKCPVHGFYDFLFVLTVICMGFKSLLRETLFECYARGFYRLFVVLAVICMGFKAFPSYYCYLHGFTAFPSYYCESK